LEVMPVAADPNLHAIRAILETPEGKIDLVRAKLAIDKMVDPSVDIEATVAKIDAIAAQNKRALPANASAWTKMLTLRQFFYFAGPWNDNHPWHYNFDHPRGDDMADMLLSNYLETRKGQCISMPLLFMFVAQRLGMEVALALAPNHTFVMLKNDGGAWLNLETTADGAPTRLETYQRQRPMSKRALDNGSYMRPLSKRETVASMSNELIQFYLDEEKLEQAAALAELTLPYAPSDISIWIYKSNAYKRIIRRDFMSHYRTSKDIPADQFPRFNELAGRSVAAEQRAFELGFLPPSEGEDSDYMNTVNKAKATFNNNQK
ncbi:hypothetical protein LPV64_03725, partial [Ralstonia pseudosolanacearum]|nr:hypothetical protein [Ralstonia pseudosolanacearum]